MTIKTARLAVWAIFMTGILTGSIVAHPAGEKRILFQGYSRTVHGSTIDYRSCQPDANSALIVRSLDEKELIEWETQPVPEEFEADSATFVWIFGINANLEARSFELLIDGDRTFKFTRPAADAPRSWVVEGDGGARLEFRTTLVDRHNDLFGYAFMTVPASFISTGKPLTLSVHGESGGSRAWFMTFQRAISETVMVTPHDALLKDGGGLRQPVAVDIVHMGESARVRIAATGASDLNANVKFGHNRYVLKLPEARTEERASLEVAIDGSEPHKYQFVRKPVRQWTVYLVQHSHTDIGYTRPQTDILPEHLRFIDYALDYCDQTDQYPDDAKFRWTCEASWPVREYLKNRPPAQIERLKKRVREGRIEVTGMMFNMSEVADENSYVAFVQPIQRFRQMGLPVISAMQDDVNGAAWCLVDYFSDIGVKYLTMGQNAARALRPFDIPTSFWWESPSGKRLLVFRADHYNTGNFIGMERGNLETVEPEMFAYLKNLEAGTYPFDRIAVQYSGYFTDNSAPSTAACEVIKQWNTKYAWPRLRNATVHEFPQEIEQKHSKQLPVFRAAWPDWWTDGFGSGARETAAARKTQADMIVNQGLLSMARILGSVLPDETRVKTEAVHDALLFYDEHTFGAAESISDPRVENSMVQWAEKSAYAWDAVKNSGLLRESAMGLIQGFLPKSDVPTIAVFNTLNWTRSGLIPVYVDNQILPPDQEFRIVDADGKNAPAQLISRRADGSTWGLWVENIPAIGYRMYRIEVGKNKRPEAKRSESAPEVMENDFYRLSVDTTNATITALFDKELNRDLIDGGTEWRMGQFIYETLTNREQLELLRLEGHSRNALKNVRVKDWADGDLWKSITFAGESDGYAPNGGVTCEIRMYKRGKRIEMHFSGMKLPVASPEAVYVAFPFALPDWKIVYEAQGGTVVPGVDQLAGSSSDWQTVQNFASVRGKVGQVVLGSDEVPLMQFGDINTGKFQKIARVEKPAIYSWVLNNYWTTNFLATQEGELKWSYYLTSSRDTSTSFATRFGWSSRVPLVSRVLPAGPAGKGAKSASLVGISPPGLLLVSARPSRDGSGIILHLREVDGKSVSLPLSGVLGARGVKSVAEVNVLEEDVAKSGPAVQFRPFEVKFLKIVPR